MGVTAKSLEWGMFIPAGILVDECYTQCVISIRDTYRNIR